MSAKGIYAKVVADSISLDGHRLTTFEVRLWRGMLSEFNTHRVFSRNSESSRAVPWAKKVQRIKDDPYIPVLWSSEQKGMEGGDEIERPWEAEDLWVLRASVSAVEHAEALGEMGVHKSIVNRLLEPFMFHTVIVTATSYGNFFGLRCNPKADPNIRVAAEQMQAAYEASQPDLLDDGQWHLPYVEGEDLDAIAARVDERLVIATAVQVSSARCARVSYLTQDGRRDFEEDLNLYDRLTSADPMHASPLEHVATPDGQNAHEVVVQNAFTKETKTLTLPKYGNLIGWHQHRFDVEVGKNYQAYA